MSAAAPVVPAAVAAPAPGSVRLPTTQRITRYDIALVPDLVNFTFQGALTADLTLEVPTDTVVLNSLECTFLANADGTPRVTISLRDVADATVVVSCTAATLDVPAQTVTFTFGSVLAAGAYSLNIPYEGILNDQLAGFYRSSYKAADGSTKHMAVTQFEATDARRALPCVDEPAAKATFDVTLIVPAHLTAVSNMPVLQRDTTASSADEGAAVSRGLNYEAGLVRYRYYSSPIMSTYLLAFVIGEFDYISQMSESGTEVRVYTGLGKTHLGRFSLDTACKALDFYNEYMGCEYPLPKMDLLAIPDFAAGAMENWGCITYRETALLVDPSNSSAAAMQRVARTVCHEIAHMWFGNLVTMEWWSFLWLNEGFARFMEHLAVDNIYPEWKIWESFVAEVFAQAQSLDSLETSHPVEVAVQHPSEINEIFDSISYAKGASLIRMLNSAIGEFAFREGLQLYLKKFAYQNTLSSDLWAAFSETSGTDVAALMDNWCTKVGYPVVKVSESQTKQHLCLCQERFLAEYDANNTEKLNATLWTIPIQIASWKREDLTAEPHITKILFKVQSGEYPVWGAEQESVLKFNPNQSGFYRTQYTPELFAQIVPSIPQLPPIERLGLLRDTFALASSGRTSITLALGILKYYATEENYAVVSALSGNLSVLASLHANEAHYPQIQALIRSTYAASYARLGWEGQAGVKEDAIVTIFRGTVLSMLSSIGEQADVIATALAKFRAFVADPKANNIPADLRSAIYSTAAKRGTDEDLASLLALYRGSELQEEKNRVLVVLGLCDSKSPTAQKRIDAALAMLLSDEVRPSMVSFLMSGIGSTKLGRVAAWKWFKDNYEASIKEKFCKGQNFIISGLLNSMLGGWSSTDILAEMDAFFSANPIPQATRALSQLRESITMKATRLVRESADVAAWVAANPQA